MTDIQTAPDTTTTDALRGPWRAILSTGADLIDLADLDPDDEVDISIRRGTALPVKDAYGDERLPGTCRSGDVIDLWDCLYVEDGDPSTDAPARWAQAQAMAAGLNAASGRG